MSNSEKLSWDLPLQVFSVHSESELTTFPRGTQTRFTKNSLKQFSSNFAWYVILIYYKKTFYIESPASLFYPVTRSVEL